MKSRTLTALGAALALVAAGACLEEDVTGVRTADIDLVVPQTTVSTGEVVNVTFEAQGTGIARVVIDWGDGQSDTTTFSGPVEVAGDRTHAYAAAGTFVLVGTVAASAGVASDSVTITVN